MTDYFDDYFDDYFEDGEDDSTFDCPNCGSAVYEDSPRCPQCGDYVTNRSRSSRPWLFVIIVIVLVVLMLWPFLAGILSM